MKSLGTHLKQRRLEQGLSEKGVAGIAGISLTYYSAIERGLRIPPANTLDRILRALNFSQEATKEVRVAVAIERGLPPDDAHLPEDIQALMLDIRNAANNMQPRFTKWLRAKIREISD